MGAIYLVRHGQAPAHAYGIGVGVDRAQAAPAGVALSDEDVIAGGLTDLGWQQARRTGRELSGLVDGFTAAISGGLPRQQATLRGVLEAFGTSPEPLIDTGWDEYEIPSTLNLPADELAALYADGVGYQRLLDGELSRWVRGEISEAESFAAYGERVRRAADTAVDLAGSGQTVLVVSSAGTITRLIAELWGVPDDAWPRLTRSMFNASFSRLLVGRSGITVVSVNEHAHLADRAAGLATFR